MKKIMLILALMLAATAGTYAHRHQYIHANISFETFYDELMPYGEWINSPEYGYVWRPYTFEPDGFRPYYTRGNWVYTEAGWTWVSNYRWGWATFHYGRWYFDNHLGWAWIPGYQWAPAWVTWGAYGDSWAWAPLGPNMYITPGFTWHAPAFWWTVVPRRHFCSHNWHAYTHRRPVHVTNITYITNVYNDRGNSNRNGNWYHGPRVTDVERHANTRVKRTELADLEKNRNTVTRNTVTRNTGTTINRTDLNREREERRPPVKPETRVNRTEPAKERTVRTQTANERTVRTVTPKEQTVRTEASKERVIRKEPAREQVKRTEPKKEQVKRATPRGNDASRQVKVKPKENKQPVRSSSPGTGIAKRSGN
jgi:hypothetical protein